MPTMCILIDVEDEDPGATAALEAARQPAMRFAADMILQQLDLAHAGHPCTHDPKVHATSVVVADPTDATPEWVDPTARLSPDVQVVMRRPYPTGTPDIGGDLMVARCGMAALAAGVRAVAATDRKDLPGEQSTAPADRDRR